MKKFKKPEFNTKNVNLGFIGIAVLLIIIGSAFRLNPDTDSFFLISTGKYIAQTGRFPTENIWTMHNGLNMTVQQWLCCALNYETFIRFGYAGLAIASIILSCIMAICIYAYARLFSIDRSNAFLKTCFLWLFSYVYTTTRPYTGTIIICTMVLFSLEKLKRTKDIGYGMLTALLVVLQANWQSSMVIFPILFTMVYVLEAIADHEDEQSLKHAVTMTMSVGAAFINPYGINNVVYVLRSYGSDLHYIAEMQAPIVGGKYGAIIICAILALFYKMYKYKRDKVPFEASQALLLAGAVGMAIMNIRSMWMVLIGITPILPDIIKPKERKANPFTYGSVCLVVATTMIGIFMVAGDSKEGFEAGILAKTYPNITAYTEANVEPGSTLFSKFETGQYFQTLGYKTFIDGRAELYMKEINGKYDYWNEYCNITFGEDPNIKKFIDKYDFDYIEADDGSLVGVYVKACGEYEELARDNQSALWRRKE